MKYRKSRRKIFAQKKCKECKNFFIPNQSNQIYCNEICSRIDWRKRKSTSVAYFPLLDKSNIGTISELLVSADLLKKGYDVFRALSPHSKNDLVITKDDKLKTVEVKTGRFYKMTLHYKKSNIADITAVVTLSDNKIFYFPDLC